MKKPLYYAIRPSGRFGGGPALVAVTSERGSHWWGRTTTHAAAEAVKREVQSVRDHYTRERGTLNSAVDLLRKYEEARIKQVIEGRPVSALVHARALTQTEQDRQEARDELAALLERVAAEGTAGLELDAALDRVLSIAGVL